MWLIAGPNGAGKSSFVETFIAELDHIDLIKLNADERTVQLREQFPVVPQDELNLKAAKEIDQKVVACIENGQSFLVETVLSSDKYRDDVITAKEKGFKIGLIYLSLYPPELSPERIRVRVAKGGHNVDHDKAIKRHRKSHEQLSWFAAQADTLFVFDNSGDPNQPVLVALRGEGKSLKYLAHGVNPAIDNALKGMLP